MRAMELIKARAKQHEVVTDCPYCGAPVHGDPTPPADYCSHEVDWTDVEAELEEIGAFEGGDHHATDC